MEIRTEMDLTRAILRTGNIADEGGFELAAPDRQFQYYHALSQLYES